MTWHRDLLKALSGLVRETDPYRSSESMNTWGTTPNGTADHWTEPSRYADMDMTLWSSLWYPSIVKLPPRYGWRFSRGLRLKVDLVYWPRGTAPDYRPPMKPKRLDRVTLPLDATDDEITRVTQFMAYDLYLGYNEQIENDIRKFLLDLGVENVESRIATVKGMIE